MCDVGDSYDKPSVVILATVIPQWAFYTINNDQHSAVGQTLSIYNMSEVKLS